MHGITLLGSIPVIAALIVAAGTFLRVRTGSWRPLLLLAVVSAGGLDWLTDVLGAWALATAWLAFVLTVTTTVGRIRPSAALLPPARPPLEPASQ